MAFLLNYPKVNTEIKEPTILNINIPSSIFFILIGIFFLLLFILIILTVYAFTSKKSSRHFYDKAQQHHSCQTLQTHPEILKNSSCNTSQ